MTNDADGQERAAEIHRRAAEIHRRAAETHDRTAALHEDSANLHERHARQVAVSPDRLQRAHRVADHAREAAACARTYADREQDWAITAAIAAERAAAAAEG